MWLSENLCFLIVAANIISAKEFEKPNIVFIVADDLGWDDVSFHGSDQIMTPNIDMLAYHGVILNQYYTDPDGSASRSAMFTGKYSMRIGMQGTSIKAAEDRGIPLKEKLLPQLLRESGYKTHLVGKWDVGKSRACYLPTNRGFDTFYGFLGDSVDYLTYNAVETFNGTTFCGIDLFDNLEVVQDQNDYLTDVLTDRAVEVIRRHNTSAPMYLHVSHATPHVGGALVNLQPPSDLVKANDHIVHSARRLYAAMVSSLDISVGNIVAALAERDILDNTIIIFTSDNGAPSVGPSQNFGSNFPFRGIKSSPWEGGVRSIGIVWKAAMQPKISDDIFHVTDWLPTLMSAAESKINETIDGIDQWNSLMDDEESKRNDVLIAIDDLKGWAAYREGDFKIVIGNLEEEISGHYGNDFKIEKTKNNTHQPEYDDILLVSETARVFKEILGIHLDGDLAFIIRSEMNISDFIPYNKNYSVCSPTKTKGCLYNISADPLETNDIWESTPEVVKHMALRLRSLWAELKPRRQPRSDSRANPSLWNYVWCPWAQNDEIETDSPRIPQFPLQVTTGEVQYLVDFNFSLLTEKLKLYIGDMKESIHQSVKKLFSIYIAYYFLDHKI